MPLAYPLIACDPTPALAADTARAIPYRIAFHVWARAGTMTTHQITKEVKS